jgi:regulator of protease activity HflC (stomatin/prohibitin superfamily)
MIETISLAILAALALFVLYHFIRALQLVPHQRAYIVERLGNYHKTLDSGFHALIPFIDRTAYKQDLREQAITVHPQDCFTEDNVKVKVDGVIYLSVVDPVNASYGVTDYRRAAVNLAQTTTRSVIGKMELDTTFQERALISRRVVEVLDEVDDAWGVKVHRYEIQNIDTPRTVQKAMERQMTAERERRAVVARSEGEQESVVNEAQGQKEEIINQSEGEMQRRINEAEGRAEEIEELASATAEAIEEMAAAISKPQGDEAIQLQMAEQYLSALARLGKQKNQILLPADLTRFDEVLDGLSLDDFSLRIEEATADGSPQTADDEQTADDGERSRPSQGEALGDGRGGKDAPPSLSERPDEAGRAPHGDDGEE